MKASTQFVSFTFLLVALQFLLLAGCKKEVEKEIPTLTTTAISSITDTMAISGGSISSDGGSPITERGICWNKYPNPTISNYKKASGSGDGSYTSALNGLQSETVYYVRAYATNEMGTAYGNELTFKTLEGIFSTFTDSRDGTVYATVKIGNMVWMSENLRYLPEVCLTSMASDTIPCYYIYMYNGTDTTAAKASPYYSIFGVLYNWAAAMNTQKGSASTVQGVCPAGWHLPSDAEWSQLTDYLGGSAVAGGKLKETGYWHWDMPNTGATNETGFTARAGGRRNFGSNIFFALKYGYWWTASESGDSYAWYRSMSYDNSRVERDTQRKEFGFSVRCVRNSN